MTNVVQIGLKGHQGACLEVVRERDDVRLAGVWDDDPAVLSAFAKNSLVDARTLVTGDLSELLALPDVQVAVLCEDNRSRPDNLIACAERGWQLMAEKPLAIDLDSLERVRAAVAAAGVRLSMLLTMRFESPYLAMKERIDAGAVGRPVLLSAQKSYRRGNRPAWQQNAATFGGTIPFIGIHAIDLIRWLTGVRFARVAARQHNQGLPGAGAIEETVVLLLESADGALADVRLDYLRPAKAPTHGDDRFRVAGSDGVIEAIGGQVTLLTAEAEPEVIAQPERASIFGSFLNELAGGPPHPLSAEDCFRMTEICLKARQAAESGEWVGL